MLDVREVGDDGGLASRWTCFQICDESDGIETGDVQIHNYKTRLAGRGLLQFFGIAKIFYRAARLPGSGRNLGYKEQIGDRRKNPQRLGWNCLRTSRRIISQILAIHRNIAKLR